MRGYAVLLVGLGLCGCDADTATTGGAGGGGSGGSGGGGGDGGAAVGGAGGGGAGGGTGNVCGVVWPLAAKDDVDAKVGFRSDFSDQEPLVGLTVQACPRADVDCTTPDAEGVTAPPPVTSFEAGVHWTLPFTMAEKPTGWDGYLKVLAGTSTPEMGMGVAVPETYIYDVKPWTGDATPEFGLTVQPDLDLLVGLAAQLGIDKVQDTGFLGIIAGSCSAEKGGAGVIVEVETAAGPAPHFLYFDDNGLPDPSLTETKSSGLVGFLNVEPGIVKVRSRLATTGQVLGELCVQVRADALTQVGMNPSPPDDCQPMAF